MAAAYDEAKVVILVFERAGVVYVGCGMRLSGGVEVWKIMVFKVSIWGKGSEYIVAWEEEASNSARRVRNCQLPARQERSTIAYENG